MSPWNLSAVAFRRQFVASRGDEQPEAINLSGSRVYTIFESHTAMGYLFARAVCDRRWPDRSGTGASHATIRVEGDGADPVRRDHA